MVGGGHRRLYGRHSGSGRPRGLEERHGSAALRTGGLECGSKRCFRQGVGACYATRQHKHQTNQGVGLGRGGVGISQG